jgi:hypothetical protein
LFRQRQMKALENNYYYLTVSVSLLAPKRWSGNFNIRSGQRLKDARITHGDRDGKTTTLPAAGHRKEDLLDDGGLTQRIR